MKLLIKDGIVVNANEQRQSDVLIENGLIKQISPNIIPSEPCEIIQAKACYVMPGGVDVHTHFNIDTGLARSCDDRYPRSCLRWHHHHYRSYGVWSKRMLLTSSTINLPPVCEWKSGYRL